MISLRPYQQEAVTAIRSEWNAGRLATLAAMATGTGKTRTALATLALERDAGKATRILGIAHRRELIYQPRDTILANFPDALPLPGIVMADNDECNSEFVIASIQTIAKPARLERLLSYGEFSHLWIDEGHHTTSKTYLELVSALKAKNPHLRILGTTATPKRTDGIELKQVFDSVAYKLSIKDAVKLGALVPFTVLAVEIPVDISQVKLTEDGWDDEELGELLRLSNAEEIITETWQKHASDRQTIAFTSSVAQAASLALAFQRIGIESATINDKTPKEKRKAILKEYERGSIQFISNYGVLTEGYDNPAISCVIMARPTRSDSIYLQAVGRGLRTAPGKQSCLILDFAPLNARDMRMAGDLLLGKPKEQRQQEARAEKSGLILSCFGINSKGEGIDGDPDSVQMRVLDYLGSHRLAWTYDGGLATVSIASKISLAIVLPQKDRLAVADTLRESGNWSAAWEAEYQRISSFQVFAINERRLVCLGASQDWDGATDIATAYADEHAEDWCSAKKSKWRNSPASDKQAAFCKRLGAWRDGMSRGQVGQAITHALSLKSLKKDGILK